MSPDMVTWKDYEGVEGFGVASGTEVEELNKALEAGGDINPPGPPWSSGDGFALRVESLEATLRVTTYRMEHVVLWRNLPKLAAYNVIEEHNILSSYAENEDSAWMAEGDLPEDDSSTYERAYARVKYLGTTRRVTHPMTLIRPAHGNVVAQETVNGTMKLLRVLERALFYGDSSLSTLQFDGYVKLIQDNAPATNVIDLRGRPLSEDVLMDAALTVFDAPNYGMPTDLYLNPKTKTDLVKSFFPKARYDQFAKTNEGMIGLDIRGFTSPAGDVRFNPDVFITDGGGATSALGSAAKRPGAPTPGAVTTPADAASKFEADDAGDYFYTAQAVNRYGRSAPVDVVAGPTAVTVAAGDKVTFTLTPGAGELPDWYEIFRTKKDGATGSERLVLRVPSVGAGATTINDFNDNLPGTTIALLLQQNLESLSVKQLAPMVKIPLATVDTSIRWAQVIYLVPVMYAYGKNLLFKNIGRAEGYVGAP
jgi:hypothetical protein